MKRYKAIVIDGKKVIRRCIGAGILLLVTSLVMIELRIAGASLPQVDGQVYAKRILDESFPAIHVFSKDNTEDMPDMGYLFTKLRNFVLTFDPSDMRTVFFSEVPLIRAVNQGYLASEAFEKSGAIAVYNPENADMGEGEPEPASPEAGQYPIKEVDSGQAKALGENSGKILIRNETNYSINVDSMLNEPLKFNMSGEGPKILIVHTHATESYSPEGSTTYSADKSDRSMESDKNMIRVGEAMKQVFEEKGIEVIHDTTLHDHPNFNGSYENSRKTVERYLTEYPGICIVLDIHRDAFVYEDGSKAKFVTEIDGKKVAQLMLVVGTNAGGLEHPEWKENMKLALKLQKRISGKYPTLMRGVNLRKERFNGHTTYGSMIIEVGSSGNTMTEAVDGAKYAASEIADFLNTLK